jgi:hypothetical protein
VRQEVGELPSCHHGVIGSQEGCSLQKYKDPSASRCQGVGLLPSRYRDLCYKWKEETMVGIGRYHSGTSTLAALASAGNGRGSDHFLDSITGCVWRLVRSSAGAKSWSSAPPISPCRPWKGGQYVVGPYAWQLLRSYSPSQGQRWRESQQLSSVPPSPACMRAGGGPRLRKPSYPVQDSAHFRSPQHLRLFLSSVALPSDQGFNHPART